MIIDKHIMRIKAIFLSGNSEVNAYRNDYTHEKGDGIGLGDYKGYGQGYYTNTYAYIYGTGPGHESFDMDLFKKGDGVGYALGNFTDF